MQTGVAWNASLAAASKHEPALTFSGRTAKPRDQEAYGNEQEYDLPVV